MKPSRFPFAWGTLVIALAMGLPATGCSRESPTPVQAAARPSASVPVVAPALDPEAEFPQFLQTFSRAVLDGVDFNALLQQQDPLLMRYVASGITLQRYYNPGATCNAYMAPDWEFMPQSRVFAVPAGVQPVRGVPPVSCEDDVAVPDGLYYDSVHNLPTSVRMHEDSFEEVPLLLPAPWQQAPLMHAVLYVQGVRVKSLYFAYINDAWSLVLVDDCEPCSA